jgi:4'-phosphopantetheinyl transferase
MKQRNVPRNAWSIKTTKAGKPYIDAPQEEKHLGYNIAHDGSIVTMAFSLGRKHKVWNIGVDAVRIALPKNIPFATYVDSLSHKLTPTERAYLDVNDPGSTPVDNQRRALNRLFIIWTVKESYIKALGQPAGFDFTRIDCRIPDSQIFVDGKRLNGWEFRLFKANVGVFRSPNSVFREARRDGFTPTVPDPELQSEVYQCCMTIYRGGEQDGCVFKWGDQASELDKYLRFVTLDAMVNAAKHLSADGLGRDREITRAPGYESSAEKPHRRQEMFAARDQMRKDQILSVQKETSLGRTTSYRESHSVGA